MQSERNLRRALLMLEASKVQAGSGGMRPDQAVARADWQTFIEQLASDIVARQSPDQLLACRSKFYELLTNCILPEVILKQLSSSCLRRPTKRWFRWSAGRRRSTSTVFARARS